jgi:heme/copper-type cytochrome/quinol oxidase subunit 4
MFTTRVVASLFDFGLMVVMSAFVIALTYRIFVKANPDFHMGQEIKKGNVAVGVLMAAILVSASYILMAGTESSINMFRMHLLAPSEENESILRILGLIAAHLSISMMLAVVSISVTLRMFGRLEKELRAGKELQAGNLAVGILLAAVVVISSMYVREGVSALSKALTPQPSIGTIQIGK